MRVVVAGSGGVRVMRAVRMLTGARPIRMAQAEAQFLARMVRCGGRHEQRDRRNLHQQHTDEQCGNHAPERSPTM
mgnify:CR=1 FL=1